MSSVVTRPIGTEWVWRQPGTPERWAKALDRANAALVEVTEIEPGLFRVTSASHPGVSYECTVPHCTCDAWANGDEVCLHRAAARDFIARQQLAALPTQCPYCDGTGWEYVAIWDWRNGRPMTVVDQACTHCQRPEIPAPVAPVSPLVTELEEAKAELTRTYAILDRCNEKIARRGQLSARDELAFTRATERANALSARIHALKTQVAA